MLLGAVGDRYDRTYPGCSLVQFTQSGATYLFDLASAVGAEQEDRTVAAWTVTPATVNKRDVSYQRGFPLAADPGSLPVDRGHLIPNLSGGEFGPLMTVSGRPSACWHRADGRWLSSFSTSTGTTPGGDGAMSPSPSRARRTVTLRASPSLPLSGRTRQAVPPVTPGGARRGSARLRGDVSRNCARRFRGNREPQASERDRGIRRSHSSVPHVGAARHEQIRVTLSNG